MPGATATLAGILSRVQNRVGDTTSSIWTTTSDGGDWSDAINEAQTEILNDIILHDALELCDALDDSIAITIVDDQEIYDYHNLITVGASKTYYARRNATWGNYDVRKYPWDRYQELKNGTVTPSHSRPFYSFYGDGKFYLQPETNNGETFTFYFFKVLTVLDAAGEFPQVDDRCIPLFYPKVAGMYWQRRHNYERWRMEDSEYNRLVKKILKPFKKHKIHDVVVRE